MLLGSCVVLPYVSVGSDNCTTSLTHKAIVEDLPTSFNPITQPCPHFLFIQR